MGQAITDGKSDIGGIARVIKALEERGFDYPVLHVNGRLDHFTRAAKKYKDYIVIQYCLRGTQKKLTKDWLPLWENAKCVWSYYDLPKWSKEEGSNGCFNFYHGPLGIEKTFYNEPPKKKPYVILTHGNYQTQGTKQTVNAWPDSMAHLGEPFPTSHPSIDFYTNITDDELRELYHRTYYVCTLRRFEGFEIPAAEALACGARPILFDKDYYRQWYGDHAVYINEGTKAEEIEDLKKIFTQRRPVAAKESAWAQKFFDWDRILEGLNEQL